MKRIMTSVLLCLLLIVWVAGCANMTPLGIDALKADIGEWSELQDRGLTLSKAVIQSRNTSAEDGTDVVSVLATVEGEQVEGTIDLSMSYSLSGKKWELVSIEAVAYKMTPLQGPSETSATEQVKKLYPDAVYESVSLNLVDKTCEFLYTTQNVRTCLTEISVISQKYTFVDEKATWQAEQAEVATQTKEWTVGGEWVAKDVALGETTSYEIGKGRTAVVNKSDVTITIDSFDPANGVVSLKTISSYGTLEGETVVLSLNQAEGDTFGEVSIGIYVTGKSGSLWGIFGRESNETKLFWLTITADEIIMQDDTEGTRYVLARPA